MDALLNAKVARHIFALPFGIFGLMHFVFGAGMAGMVPAYLPGGVFWVYLTGLAMIAACAAMITGKQIRLATTLLALLLLIYVLMVHIPGLASGNQMAMPSMLKDLSLLGGALLVGATYKDSE
jgi:uncharacterized membrane protein